MRDNFNPQLLIWSLFSVLVAVSLAVSAVQSLIGVKPFASWHLATLALSLLFVWMELPDIRKARLIIRIKWAISAISSSTRAVKGPAALDGDGKIETEPR